ncbi:hypothetical protein BROUX41_004152 [Berkeleyomyces rouxiae]|uniref:uncharacterized protein n=1 Tax=Berkeleyomyces rouxiae TaxID=2035830 RepID=UPI003B7E3218
MGLVDYDSSGSDDETPRAPPPPPKATKKPFQKLLDGGKIRVSLPSPSVSADAPADEPPAKRARTGAGASAHKFSGFNSFLPAPKNRAGARASATARPASSTTAAASTDVGAAGEKSAPRAGLNLKTGAGPAWSRGGPANGGDNDASGAVKGPEIPEGMTPAEDVKIVGKPLMFKPLSVMRKQAKKPTQAKKTGVIAPTPGNATARNTQSSKPVISEEPSVSKVADNRAEKAADSTPEKPPKVALFSFAATEDAPAPDTGEAYVPVFESFSAAVPTYNDITDTSTAAVVSAEAPTNLAALADSMQLSATQRRELFGRGRDAVDLGSAKLVTFDMDQEYAHNEALRAKGEEQVHNPLRAIQPGKHSLRQLVSQVQNQREALEESFAAGKNKRREAGGRYGW